MQIDMLEFKKTIDILFDHIIKTRGIKAFELKEDYYWSVAYQNIYDPGETPEPTLGSLYEDWEFLSEVLKEDGEPLICLLWKLAPLIQYLGDLGEYSDSYIE